jgi:hypothetical protein
MGALACLGLALAGPARADPMPDAEAAIRAAQAHERGQRWAEAFALYAPLADRGHPLAARQAYRIWHDPALRAELPTPPSAERLERWHGFSACGGHCSTGTVAASGC